jgi:uncharacterized BrkB/YihY/UPF0761 family membrane protein
LHTALLEFDLSNADRYRLRVLRSLQKHIKNSRVTSVIVAYQHIHGSLLTKGVSFSLIVAAVPLLFMLVTISSFFLNAEVIGVLDDTLYGFLPEEQRQSLLEGVRRYAGREGSLSIVTGAIFFLAVHNLFFDLNRMIATGLGIRKGGARSRLAALIAPLVFVVLLYASTLLSSAGRWVGQLVQLSPTALQLGAIAVSTLVIGLVILLIFRWVGGRSLRLLPAWIVSLVAAILWQSVLSVAGITVRVAGTRFVAYGVLAWAVVFLLFMRLIAEILLYGSLILRAYRAEDEATTSEPSQYPD